MMKANGSSLLAVAALACVAIAPRAFAQPAAGGWSQSQQTNTAESYTYTRFTLAGTLGAGGADQPALVLNCIPPGTGTHRSELLSASLYVGAPLKIIYVEPEEIHGTNYFPKVAVQVRTDGANTKDQWNPGTEKTAALVPREALQKIVHAHSVAIAVDDDKGGHLSVQFQIPDPSAVERACSL